MRKITITQDQFTEIESDSLRRYLNDINTISPLTEEEEKELVDKVYYDNDAKAKEKLIRGNLRFVVSVAKQYNQSSVKLEDLINEGNIGLQNAVERFDPNQGYKFISYAVWWIRKGIMDFLNDNSRAIRLPFNRLNHLSKVDAFIKSFEQEHQRQPTHDEVKDALICNDITEKDVDKALELLNFRTESIDNSIGEDDEDESRKLIDVIENSDSENPEDVIKSKDKKDLMGMVLETLTEEERIVLDLTFGLSSGTPLSLSKTGEEIGGKSREMVRIIKRRAINKLKERIGNPEELVED